MPSSGVAFRILKGRASQHETRPSACLDSALEKCENYLSMMMTLHIVLGL